MASTLEAIDVSNSALPAIDIIGFSSSSLIDRQTVADMPASARWHGERGRTSSHGECFSES